MPRDASLPPMVTVTAPPAVRPQRRSDSSPASRRVIEVVEVEDPADAPTEVDVPSPWAAHGSEQAEWVDGPTLDSDDIRRATRHESPRVNVVRVRPRQAPDRTELPELETLEDPMWLIRPLILLASLTLLGIAAVGAVVTVLYG